MAHLMELSLDLHPRLGPCFLLRFSWNSRVENPIDRIKSVPPAEREYEPENRRWWIAAAHVDLLAALFDNWPEQVAALARARPDAFAAVMVAVLRARILAGAREILDAVPAITGDNLLVALGEAVGSWLEEWRRAAPRDAGGLTPKRLRQVRGAAVKLRQELETWGLRAAFVRELLSPTEPPVSEGPEQ